MSKAPQSGTGAADVIEALLAENQEIRDGIAHLIDMLRRIAGHSTDPAARAAALAALQASAKSNYRTETSQDVP